MKTRTHILMRWILLSVALGILSGFWLACAVVNALLVRGPWLYVALLALAALSGAGMHKLARKCR